MSLRLKSLLMISATLAGMSVILALVAANIFQPGFQRLEQSSVQEKLHSVVVALSEDQAGMSRIAQDYARSNETYAFMQSGEAGYIQEYFPTSTYLRHELSLVVFIDESGKLVYGGEFDFTGQDIHELPESFADQLPAMSSLLSQTEPGNRSRPTDQNSGGVEPSVPHVLRLPDGPALIAAYAVLGSSGQGPARGVLIFGRSLESEIEKVSQQTGLQITHEPWDATLQTAAPQTAEEFIRPINEQTIAGYTALRDFSGEPDSLLRVELPRVITQQGQASLRRLMMVLVGASLGFILVITLLLEKVILAPLAQIRTAIHTIGASEGFGERLPVSGKDELARLASSINGILLEALEQRNEELNKRWLQIRTAAEVAQITTGSPVAADSSGSAQSAGPDESDEQARGELAGRERRSTQAGSPTLPGGQKQLLKQTINLIVDRFGYANASIYLLDPSRENAVLAETTGEGNNLFKVDTLKLAVGSRSMVGWVTANNQPRVSGDVNQDAYYLKDDFLPNISSEAVIPISTGELVLGALDVQSHKPNAFQAEDAAVLQTLANQLATAIYNLRLLDATQFNLEEAALLYQASRNINQAESAEEVLRAVDRALRQTSYQSAVYTFYGAGLQAATAGSRATGLRKIFPSTGGIVPMSERLPVTSQDLEALLPEGSPFRIIDLPTSSTLPLPLIHLLRQWQCETAALIPVKGEYAADSTSAAIEGGEASKESSSAGAEDSRGNGTHRQLSAIFVLGAQQRGMLNPTILQPYASLAEVTATALQKIQALQQMEKSLAEVRTLNAVSQALSVQTDLSTIYQEIHNAVRQFMGEVDFLVALLDSAGVPAVISTRAAGYLGGRSDQGEPPDASAGATIRIPYMWERGEFLQVEPISLGEGLTSMVIRSCRPLMIIENTEDVARRLGAVVIGKPAKSWLGVPLMVGGEVIGAIVVQDVENEHRFTGEDQRLLTTLAIQAAAAIRNAHILETTRRQAKRERLLREITSKIRSSVDMQTILETAASELGRAFDLHRAHIQAGLTPTEAVRTDFGTNPGEDTEG